MSSEIMICSAFCDLLIGLRRGGVDFFTFTNADFEAGVYDVLSDMNVGGEADWFTTIGVDRNSILALDYLGGVLVTTAAIGFGANGGGAYIENFSTAQFWGQLYSL